MIVNFKELKVEIMEELLLKYRLLSPAVQQEVNDFLDFMLSKHKGHQVFDMKSWKSKIKNVSVWSNEDVKSFEESKIVIT